MNFSLNSLLASSYLNKNIHFRAAKRGLLVDSTQFVDESEPTMDRQQRGDKRKKTHDDDPQEIAQILPNNQICFAGVRLDYKLPRERGNAQNFVDIINAFSQYMSHNQAMRSGTFRRLSLDDQ